MNAEFRLPLDFDLPARATSWQLRTRRLEFSHRPAIMGVINVTPDSFSDGGQFQATDAAIEHGLRLAAQGAEILDIGGESTRPYAEPVAADEELRRVIPVVEALANQTGAIISIDTSKAVVARAAGDSLADADGLADWLTDEPAAGLPESVGPGEALVEAAGEAVGELLTSSA